MPIRGRVVLVRLFVLLSLSPSVMLVAFSVRAGYRQHKAAERREAIYARLIPELSEYDVKYIFGTEGIRIADAGWPIILRQMPGYKDVPIRFRTEGGEQTELGIVPPDTAVSWKKWALESEGWVIVGFLHWGREPTVIWKGKRQA